MTNNSVPGTTDKKRVPRQRKSAEQQRFAEIDVRNADPTAADAPTMAQRVVAHTKAWRFFRSSEGRLFGEHEGRKGWALPVNQRGEWARQLAVAVAHDSDSWPHSRDIATAVDMAGWMAGSESREVYMRSSPTAAGSICIDPADGRGRVIVVAPGAWSVQRKVPEGVLLRRGQVTAPLAVPCEGEGEDGLQRLWDLVPVAEADRPIVLALLLSVWMPDVASPIVQVVGRQDAGKTTMARFLLSLVDPVTTERGGSLPVGEQDWKARLGMSRAVLMDNVSTITAGQSDTLCKITTGGEAVSRTLWTDDEAHVTSLSGVVWMTSIDTGVIRSDLASRMVQLELESLSPERRRTMTDLVAAQEASRVEITTALVELLATVLEVRPTISTAHLPHRCADFAVVLRCIDSVLGTDGEGRLAEQSGSLSLDVLDSDPVAQVLLSAVAAAREGSSSAARVLGTLTPMDLLSQLTSWADTHGGQQRMPSWPKTPKVLTGHLARIAPDLARSGVTVSTPRKSNGRRVMDVTDTLADRDEQD